MKLLIACLVINVWTLCCHSQFLNGYVIRPLSATTILPSYNVDGSVHHVHDDLVNHLFDPKADSRYILHIHRNVRSKRATSFSYKTPDSSRSETLDRYVDPRVKDGHALNRYQGKVSWISPEGIPFQLDYSADGGGFHPQAQHLPDSPNHRSFFSIGLN